MNKRTREQKAVEAELLEAWHTQSPGKLPGILDAALSAAQEGDFDPLGRLLPYIARKMPTDVEISGSDMTTIEVIKALVAERIAAEAASRAA